MTLACSHAFCAPCIAHVADATLQHGTRSVVVPCPLCKRPLEAADIGYERLDGSVRSEERWAAARAFQASSGALDRTLNGFHV